MNKLSQKIFAAASTVAMASTLLVPAFVAAQGTDTTAPANVSDKYGLDSNFNIGVGQDTDLKATIVSIINIILGFLGIIAVIIILAGGFKWMTAAGNEDKVGEARKMITQGVIGLVIIFAAWGIASFVINQLYSATT